MLSWVGSIVVPTGLSCSTLLCYFVSAAPEHQNPLFKIYVVRPEDWLVNKYYVNVHITRERERDGTTKLFISPSV